MKLSKGKGILLICALQLFVLVFGIAHVNFILFGGETAVIEMTGFDPYDPLRGRYLDLRVADLEVKLEANSIERYPLYEDTFVYVILDKSQGSDTYDTFAYASLDKPTNGELYIKCPSLYRTDENNVRIAPGLDTYYLNETQALQLDAITRDADTEMHLILKIMNGNYTIDSILINGELY